MKYSIPSQCIKLFDTIVAKNWMSNNLEAETYALFLGFAKEDTINVTEIVFPPQETLLIDLQQLCKYNFYCIKKRKKNQNYENDFWPKCKSVHLPQEPLKKFKIGGEEPF